MTTKVSSAMQDLTDDYAFSGTVSGAGKVVQVVNTQTGAVATGTTTTVNDDSIMQNTEGDEYMTLSITPTNSSNKLKIDVVLCCLFHSNAGGQTCMAGLFQDSTANALASSVIAKTSGNYDSIKFTHYMAAGTTSSTAFKARFGASLSGTTTFNGSSGSRLQGGVMASSITITEIAV